MMKSSCVFEGKSTLEKYILSFTHFPIFWHLTHATYAEYPMILKINDFVRESHWCSNFNTSFSTIKNNTISTCILSF